MSASGPASLIGSFFRQEPGGGSLAPLPFMAGHERLRQIAALWSDGRCLIARGYEDDPELAAEIERLQQRHKIPQALSRRSGTLQDVAAAWSGGLSPVTQPVIGTLKSRLRAIFAEAATAGASDVVFAHDGTVCRVWAIINDAKLELGHPLCADEGRQVMGFLFHSKVDGSAQTSYQRGEFQGFSIRAGGAVPLPSAVSGLRCQRGPHDPDSDHMYCRLFYRDRLDGGMTLEDLGFSADEAAIFTRIRMARHGAILLGGSTGDGKSTTLAVNLSLQLAEHRGELNVVTLEDPVEYRIPGAIQIAVPTSGSGEERAAHYRRALMHFCRVHPACGMVSEIRDADAARQVLNVVDTGHQVWTTIHVATANAILFRLLDMGVSAPALVKPGNIRLLVKQTLVPLLCPACALEKPAARDVPPWLSRAMGGSGRFRFRNRTGCSACLSPDLSGIAGRAWTGYAGQKVVAEFILPDTGYLSKVADHDPIGAWDHWLSVLGGVPIGSRIRGLVESGEVDPFDALAKGASDGDGVP